MGSGGSKTHESFSIAPAPAHHLSVEPPPSAAGTGAAISTITSAEFLKGLPAAADAGAPAPIVDDDDVDGVMSGITEAGADPEIEPDGAAEAEDPTSDTTTPEAPETASVGQEWASDEVLTPIPEQLAVGDGVGVALAVGGADLLDGSANLVSYRDPKKDTSHEVLRATLTPEAEEKLLDALNPPDAPKVPIQVSEKVHGRLPIDTENQIYEDLATVAKSINHHMKDGSPVPQHTLDRLDAVTGKLDTLKANTPAGGEAEMLEHYLEAAGACKQRCAPGFTTPYGKGGKIDTIAPFEHEGEVMVTKMVPDPNFQGGGLAVTQRPMSRISANFTDGQSTWNGTKRDSSSGTELVVDLGDGYQAVVRPRAMNTDGQCITSLQGTVEVIAPPGPGHQHELLNKLGEMNIVHRPMSAAEAEWTYLQRNIHAHSITKNASVAAARDSAAGIEDAHLQQLVVKRAHEAIGLDDAQMATFARKLQLDAEADALPDKIRILRHGVAKALGHADGDALAKSDSYKPVPERARGWLTWQRIGQTREDLKKVFTGHRLIHSATSGADGVAAMLRSGVLASTEKRRQMGISKGLGMSEGADEHTGGSSSVFLRIRKNTGSKGVGVGFVWNEPGKILSQTDWYGYDGDHFGATHGHQANGQTRDPKKVAQFGASSNEVMIHNGLDLLGAHAPDKVVCPSHHRTTLLKELTDAGITMIGGKPIEKVVVAA